MELENLTHIPRHVAVIMDGNGRWAQSRNQPRVFGHRSGAKRVREIVEAAGQLGVQYLTLYAFSEENWNRPKDEVTALFKLLTRYLKEEIKHLHRNNVRLRGIGNRGKLPKDCLKLLNQGEETTKQNTGLQLVLALSYSGRSDIVNTAKLLAEKVKNGELDPQDIDESMFSHTMSTSDIPDPDLLIRTSGEQRISNFLLWEISYAELYFTNKHWPEFQRADFEAALAAYGQRNRRFGGVEEPTMPPLPSIKTAQQFI